MPKTKRKERLKRPVYYRKMNEIKRRLMLKMKNDLDIPSNSYKYTKLLDPAGVQSADDELRKLGPRF